MNSKVVCLGFSVVDIVAAGVDLDRLAQGDTMADSIALAAGGDALNQACALAGLGSPVSIMTLVGEDAFGRLLLDALARHGVECGGVTVSAAHATSASVVCVLPNAQRHILSHKGGTVRDYALSHIDLNAIGKDTGVLSFGSIGASHRLVGRDLARVFERAKQVGAVVVADAIADMGPNTLAHIAPALPLVDWFVPSYEEAACFTGLSSPAEIIPALQSLGIGRVVVKMGREGCVYMANGEIRRVPAFAVQAVDTTGAGDSFVAGFVHALTRDYPLEKALEYASAAAAISVGGAGTTGHLKSHGQVQRFMEEHR